MSERQFKVSTPDLANFVRELDRFTVEIPVQLENSRREMDRVVEELRTFSKRAERRRDDAEHDVQRAYRRWEQCTGGEDADCSAEESAYYAATARRDRAERMLFAAIARVRKADALSVRLTAMTASTSSFLNLTGRSAVSASDRLLVQLGHASVLKSRLADTGSAGSPARAGQIGAAGGQSFQSRSLRLPAGFEQLDVSIVPDSEISAINPGAFSKMPLDQMREAIGLANSRVLPLVDSGATIDDLRQLDAREGRTGPVTLARTYELFFGGDAIRVDLKGPAPSVVNGCHRIWLARQMGVTTLPARVSR